ncbi:helix-turn-helix domain-containing protein [Lachnoclostridium phytofermentans]|uniref:helix-turn-helix domain-containing protein n=1 Tax=Lachnoclostridium phytofermentans TaxID=66219 RepID=UPI001FA6E498
MLITYLWKGGEGIKIKDAIVERFRQLCTERGISFTELARRAGVTPSTVYSMLQPERRDISAVTVKKLCDGLDLCIIDFYDCDLFRNLPPEIE